MWVQTTRPIAKVAACTYFEYVPRINCRNICDSVHFKNVDSGRELVALKGLGQEITIFEGL